MPSILDIFDLLSKTNMPCKTVDHSGMGKSVSPARSILAANLENLLKASGQSKTEIARAIKKDAKAINRVLSAIHESQTDTISALAVHFKRQPWELLHPSLGEPRDEPVAMSAAQALDKIVSAISGLPQPARKALADDLALLALAPGDPETRQRVLEALEARPDETESAPALALDPDVAALLSKEAKHETPVKDKQKK